jgi:hypothetical protein
MNQHSSGDSGTTRKSNDNLKAETKEAVGRVSARVKESASEAVDEVKHQATSTLRQQKEVAADSLTSVCEALHESAERLREDDVSAFAGLMDQAADRIDRVAEYIREEDIKDMFDAAQNWARKNPALFLGGSFVAGLLVARLLKSTQAAARDENDLSDRSFDGSSTSRFGERETSRFGSENISQQYGGSAFSSTSPSSGATEPGGTGGTTGWEGP